MRAVLGGGVTITTTLVIVNNTNHLLIRSSNSLRILNSKYPSPIPPLFSSDSVDSKDSLIKLESSGFVNNAPALMFSSVGLCRASQAADLFPATSPEIVVREARFEDCLEVAETHCSSFFPRYPFPWNFMLRSNRLIGFLLGFSAPEGCQRSSLVAVIGASDDNIKIGSFVARFSIYKGYVAGILTVDTVADYLPRKGPLQQRRTGIAYISNVAVRERFRRKGIAKRLIAGAESRARIWGCRAIALHCDLNDAGAIKLYKGQGFKCIRVPEGANWPQPKTSRNIEFIFMMKLL